jgi:hypothetical protein
MIKLSISYIEIWELVVASLGVFFSFITILWWLLRDFKRRIRLELEADLNRREEAIRTILYDIQQDIDGNQTEINHINNGLEDNTHWYQRLLISRNRYLK